ncbi:MAG: hypothetical protein ACXW4Z_19735 [Candidatus Binatia bacterium]
MKTKLCDALKLAFSRFLLGALGIWCTLGPILLMTASDSAGQELKVLLVLLLAPCYAIVLVICWRARWDALRELASETRLAMCFMLAGLLLSEMTGIFLAAKHKLVPVYVYVGFLLTELAKSQRFIKACSEYLRAHTTRSNGASIKNALAEPQSPGELPAHIDELAHQSAEQSDRPAESQRTLAEYEQQKGSLMSAQIEIRQLREIIDNLGNQLQASQSDFTQMTARHHEADGVNETLQSTVAALNRNLAERDNRIATLQSAAQDAARIQIENQRLRVENQGLRDEATGQRLQLNARDTQLRELARQNLEGADRHERLETAVNDLHRRLKDNQSREQELAAARQQLASLEERENYHSKQIPQLEARLADMEREITAAKNQAQVLDDARRRLSDTQQICQELADENRRLWQEVSRWQEGFAVSVATRVASDSKDIKVVQTRANGGAEFSVDWHSLLPTKSDEHMPAETSIWETTSPHKGLQRTRGEHRQHSSGDSPAGVSMETAEDTNWRALKSVKQQWHFGALAASVVAVAGAVALGMLGNRISPPKEATVAITSSSQEYPVEAASKPQSEPEPRPQGAVSPTNTSPEYRAQAVAKPQSKPAPQQRGVVQTVRPTPRRGTFETVLATQVYDGPSENAALVASIQAGMKVNVVNSSRGWLEIRSRYGRPPGFIRQDTAVMVAQN